MSATFLVFKQVLPGNRTTKFFFAGDSRFDDITYSHGVRQTVLTMFANQSGALSHRWLSVLGLSQTGSSNPA